MSTWVLIVLLCAGCNGRAATQIDMESEQACVLAAKTFDAFSRPSNYAYCVNRKTGEVFMPRS